MTLIVGRLSVILIVRMRTIVRMKIRFKTYPRRIRREKKNVRRIAKKNFAQISKKNLISKNILDRVVRRTCFLLLMSNL